MKIHTKSLALRTLLKEVKIPPHSKSQNLISALKYLDVALFTNEEIPLAESFYQKNNLIKKREFYLNKSLKYFCKIKLKGDSSTFIVFIAIIKSMQLKIDIAVRLLLKVRKRSDFPLTAYYLISRLFYDLGLDNVANFYQYRLEGKNNEDSFFYNFFIYF